MQLLLGLFFFFFSILLTTGRPLRCEHCLSTDFNCSGSTQVCPYKKSVCMTMEIEINASVKIPASVKRCIPENDCKHYEDLRGKPSPFHLFNITDNLAGVLVGAVIKDVVCSKAPPSVASFFPAFLGLFLMKLLS